MTTAVARAKHFQEVSSLYMNHGRARLQRHWAYWKTEELETSRTAVATCLISGLVIGAKSGQLLGSQVEKILTKEETEGELGGVIGGLFGGLFGMAGGLYAYVNLVELTPQFQEWKSFCLDNAIKEAITDNYSNDDILKDFCCPLSLCVMDIPVYSPSGTLYDGDCLAKCSRTSDGKIKDPKNNPPFHESELLANFEMAFFSQKRASFLMTSDIQNIGNCELKEVLENQLKNTQVKMKQRYEKAREFIETRRKDKIISHAQYKEELNAFEELFGVDENQPLDWTLNWKQIFSSRWKYFHPSSKVLTA